MGDVCYLDCIWWQSRRWTLFEVCGEILVYMLEHQIKWHLPFTSLPVANVQESIEEWKKGTAKNMLSKLSLCSGIPFGADTTLGDCAELRREPLKDKVVIRSVECSYAVPACSKLEEDEIVSCDECLQLAQSRSHKTEDSKKVGSF